MNNHIETGEPKLFLRRAVLICVSLAAFVGSLGAAPAPGQGFYTLTPCRVVDTRNANGSWGGPAIGANSDRVFALTGRCGIPTTADAVSVNVTVTQASAAGDLRMYPAGAGLPSASVINYAGGKTRANNAMLALSSSGGLAVHCDQAAGSVHLIIDVGGYVESGSSGGGGGGGGSSIWSKWYASMGDDAARALAVDSGGNVAVAGQYQGTANFGTGSMTSYTNPSGPTVDAFVAKYSSTGSPVWSRGIGGNASDAANGIATDVSGNVVVTGYQASASADYGGGPLGIRGGSDVFVAKYSSGGGYAWARTAGSTGSDMGTGVAVDAGGNVFVTGQFEQSADFGGGSISSAGSKDIFLVKYSSAGAHAWSKRIGGNGWETGGPVAADGAGNVVVAGGFEGTIDVGGGPLTSAGQTDIFVAKFSATGQHVWSKRFGGTGDDDVRGIDIDAAGDVLLTGDFLGTINFGGSNLTSAGYEDIFLAKLAGASGAHVWSKRFGSSSTSDMGYGVAVDGAGNVAITGFFAQTVDFGGGNITARGYDIFVAKYNSGGAHVSSRRFGDPSGFESQFGDAIAMSSGGTVYISGHFVGTLDFGAGGTMTSTPYGGSDSYLASVGP